MESLEELSLTTLQSVCAKLCLSPDGTKRLLVLRLKAVPKDELGVVIRQVEEEDTVDILNDFMHQQSNEQANVQLNENAETPNIQKSKKLETNNYAKQQQKLPDNDQISVVENVQETNVQRTQYTGITTTNNFATATVNKYISAVSSKSDVAESNVLSPQHTGIITSNDFAAATDDKSVSAVSSKEDIVAESKLKDREIELLRRENELLKREQRLLQKENEMLKLIDNQTEPYAGGVSLNLVSNFVADYDGTSDGNFWVTQLRDIQKTYKLNDNMLRALFAVKLIGRARVWLHSRRNTAEEHVDELLQQFCMTFGAKQSKLEVRRTFEQRKWRYEENFADYFNEKMMLAGKLQLDDEELMEYLIDGITSVQIRTQIAMQQHTSTGDLFKALVNIKLPKPMAVTTSKVNEKLAAPKTSKVDVRCYNCNSVGHYAADCSKPRRLPGTCYACGSTDHMVANCDLNKKKYSEEKNNYVRSFKFSSINDSNFKISLECLIDSGSPISLVRRDVVPNEIKIFEFKTDSFYGLNYTKLKTNGKCLCLVEVNNKLFEIELIVVEEDSMKYSVLLGRDFLKKTNSKILFCETNTNESETKIMNYGNLGDKDFDEMIMSIEVCDDEEKVNLKMGEDAPYKLRIATEEIFRKTYIEMQRPVEPEVRLDMKINVENVKPFNCPPRRLSYAETQALQNILDDLLEKGVIRVSESEFASAIVLVRKKTGELRMCVDFRNLNKVTAKHNYPIPLIDDLLERLGNKTLFTKLDLKNGFFHVHMSEESIKYTSFVTPLGQYEYLRMPFGLKNAPSIFQMFINKIFSDLVRQGNVIIYLDDIMIATDNIAEHLKIFEEVMKRIVNNKLELRLDKCEFLQSSVKYLGYTIDASGIRADDKGLEAIRNFPLPDKVHTMRSFLGLCSYFRRFIKDFSIIAKPLYDLTKKDRKFMLGVDELKAFETLKIKLLESPVLALFDPSAETELHCDASALGFGAILVQRKKDGNWHPVFYFSKRSNEAESKFHSYELETLAIIYALRRFRVYLHGRTFKIITDCNSLTLTLNKKELNPRIARWALEMQNFDYVVEHRTGKRMQHVDALSRCHEIMIIETNTFEENLVICQNRDPKIMRLKEELQNSEHKHYEMRNGVIYKKLNRKTLLFYVPAAMESHVLYKYHDEMGHVGISKVSELIEKSYWFPQLRAKVKNHIENCLKCIAFSSKGGKVEGYLHSIPKPNRPFEMLHIDHYGPIHGKDPRKHLFVVVDACSKFVKLYPTKTTATKEVIKPLKEYFRYYSRPKYIISDRGTCFTSGDFTKFMEENDIKHILIATGSPQANGQVERVNRNLSPMIAKLRDPQNRTTWDEILETTEFTMNNTTHRMINEHPSVMLFGINQKGKVMDKLRENIMVENYRDVKEVRAKAKEKEIQAQIYNERFVNEKRKNPTEYMEGDYVVIKNYDCNTGVARKLIPKYKGPYKITKVLDNDRYVLEDVDGFQQTQIPYRGIWAAQNIKHWFQGRCIR